MKHHPIIENVHQSSICKIKRREECCRPSLGRSTPRSGSIYPDNEFMSDIGLWSMAHRTTSRIDTEDSPCRASPSTRWTGPTPEGPDTTPATAKRRQPTTSFISSFFFLELQGGGGGEEENGDSRPGPGRSAGCRWCSCWPS